jgi:threonyl-tRNA synthetase
MFCFESEERSVALKPMSCPAHVQIFRDSIRSYRELPLRYCEFSACHRHEPSGALHGLLRTRAFTQDDAHVFCLPEQIEEEVLRFCELLRRIYARFGFATFSVGFSTRPAVRAGSDEIWDFAEGKLAAAARRAGIEYVVQPGEGAFYGPKLEFILHDIEGRRWQCGTVQLDLVLPERLGAEVILAGGAKVRPILLHHAVLGSLERFIAVLLEHTRGLLPGWLAPVQVTVASVGDAQAVYTQSVVEALTRAGIRAELDVREETLSRRLVSSLELGVPFFITVGARELAQGTVSIRERAGVKHVKSVAAAIAWLTAPDA